MRLVAWAFGAAGACIWYVADAAVSASHMKSKFAESDTNGDGSLDFEELTVARSQMGHKDGAASAERVISKWDKNGDRKIEVEEYLDYVHPKWRDEM